MSYLRRLDEIFSVMSEGSMPPGFSPEDTMTTDEFVQSQSGRKTGKIEEKDITDAGITDADVTDVNMKVLRQRRLNPPEYKKDEKGNVDWASRPEKMIHRKTIMDENGNPIDDDKLKAIITQRPKKLISQNDKLAKSGSDQIFYDLTLPAYQGLYVDEKTGEFKVVRTCPAAGECKNFCYASRGTYIIFKVSGIASSRVVNYLMNDYDGFKNQVLSELANYARIKERKGKKVVLRWHDSGDFLSEKYLLMAYDIAKTTPNILHYAYTKQVPMVRKLEPHRPKNFIFNFSFGGTHDEMIDVNKDKYSRVVPKMLFKDLPAEKIRDKDGNVTNIKFEANSIQELKKRVSELFKMDPKSVITYDELMKTPINMENKWNVLVWKGHGDDAAAREDVRGTLLLFH